MSGSLNRVMLIGSLGRDPEIRTFPNGGKVCNLRIATSKRWRDRQTGERKERTEWHSVALFNDHHIRVAEQYLRKGSKLYVEGALETRKWQDQSGQDKYTTEIVVRPYEGDIKLLGEPRGQSDNQSQGGYSGGGYSGGGYDQGPGPGDGGGPGPSDMDDDIPF